MAMILASKTHTAGNTTRWTLDYTRWLDNAATIVSAEITTPSVTCTVDPASVTVLGREVVFFLSGGAVGETLMASIVMEDSFGNIKNDSISYTVVAP
jgi:hypothetical protein